MPDRIKVRHGGFVTVHDPSAPDQMATFSAQVLFEGQSGPGQGSKYLLHLVQYHSLSAGETVYPATASPALVEAGRQGDVSTWSLVFPAEGKIRPSTEFAFTTSVLGNNCFILPAA